MIILLLYQVRWRAYNMKIKQFEGRNGAVKNQFIITTDEGKYFQSYDSIIAFIPFVQDMNTEDGTILLDETYWDYSTTTGKYRNLFLGEDTKTIKSKIASGEYQLVNLN